jgi:ABC-2 type transport system permease protein
MKRYIHLYKALLRFSFLRFATYRALFINSLVATVGWGFFQIAWIHLLTVRTRSAFGWTKNELIILAILYVIIAGVFHFFFTGNFERFSHLINKGELDFILLKPVDSQYLVTNFLQRIPNLIRVALGVCFLSIHILVTKTEITFAGWLGFAVFIIFGVALLYSLWMIYCTLLVWFPRISNLIDFLLTINGMSRYPAEMMYEVKNFILIFILPFSMAVATPVKVLVRGALDGEVAGLVILSAGLFVTSRLFWNYALRHYTSASS